ncbi:MAG TPA: flagellar assembly protein FliW [Candidatus Elarobacter sp.]
MTETVETTDREITLNLPRFGTCSYRESEVLSFPWGLPGFGSLHRFIALNLPGQEKFVWLQSLDDHSVALPTADPWAIFPDYEPQLPHYATVSLEIAHPEDFVVLSVVVVTAGAAEMTMNLLAPIVVNLKSKVGRQVMLETGGYSVRQAIPRKQSGSPAAAS